MSRWLVRYPWSGHAVVVEDATSAESAARLGIDALTEQFPDSTCCETCESVTLDEVEVWPLEGEPTRWKRSWTVLERSPVELLAEDAEAWARANLVGMEVSAAREAFRLWLAGELRRRGFDGDAPPIEIVPTETTGVFDVRERDASV